MKRISQHFSGRWRFCEGDALLAFHVAGLEGDKVYNFYPPLWTKEGKDLNKNSGKVIPIEEQLCANIHFRKRPGLNK